MNDSTQPDIPQELYEEAAKILGRAETNGDSFAVTAGRIVNFVWKRLETQLAGVTAERDNLAEPFTYSECEQSHELAKSEFKDGIDELVHCVDNANRYLNRRIRINRERADALISHRATKKEL